MIAFILKMFLTSQENQNH